MGCGHRDDGLHDRNMGQSRELFKKLGEEIIALHKHGKGYKKISKVQNLPRDTDGRVHKFRVKGTLVTLPGCGRKRKPSTAPENTSKATRAWCQNKSCKILEWPSQSPG